MGLVVLILFVNFSFHPLVLLLFCPPSYKRVPNNHKRAFHLPLLFQTSLSRILIVVVITFSVVTLNSIRYTLKLPWVSVRPKSTWVLLFKGCETLYFAYWTLGIFKICTLYKCKKSWKKVFFREDFVGFLAKVKP